MKITEKELFRMWEMQHGIISDIMKDKKNFLPNHIIWNKYPTEYSFLNDKALKIKDVKRIEKRSRNSEFAMPCPDIEVAHTSLWAEIEIDPEKDKYQHEIQFSVHAHSLLKFYLSLLLAYKNDELQFNDALQAKTYDYLGAVIVQNIKKQLHNQNSRTNLKIEYNPELKKDTYPLLVALLVFEMDGIVAIRDIECINGTYVIRFSLEKNQKLVSISQLESKLAKQKYGLSELYENQQVAKPNHNIIRKPTFKTGSVNRKKETKVQTKNTAVISRKVKKLISILEQNPDGLYGEDIRKKIFPKVSKQPKMVSKLVHEARLAGYEFDTHGKGKNYHVTLISKKQSNRK